MPRRSEKNTDKPEPEDFCRSIPELDECRFLIKKVIEQAVRDFAALEYAESSSEQLDYQTACEFLFDDSYRLNWGGKEMSLQDLLDWVDLDQEWVRSKAHQAKKRKEEKIRLRQEAKRKEENDTKEPRRSSVSRRVDGV